MSCESSVAYNIMIIKLSEYSIRDSTHKIPVDCCKFHIKHDVMILSCTGAEVNVGNKIIACS